MANQFIIKDTIVEMKALNSAEISALQLNEFNGVLLLGYYEKGDTPHPIIYNLLTTSDADDGGCIIETNSGAKLYHNFNERINILYYGATENSDISVIINKNHNCQFEIPFDVKIIKINPSYSGKLILIGLKNKPMLNISNLGIQLANVSTFRCENLLIKSDDLTNINNIAVFISNASKIEISKIETISGMTIFKFSNCNNIIIKENNLSNNSVWGIYIEGGDNIDINSNICNNNGYDGIKIGGSLSGSVPFYSKSVKIFNNTCEGNSRDGIDIAVNMISDVIIHSNILRNNTLHGIEFKTLQTDLESFVDRISISNNLISANGLNGISCQNDALSNVKFKMDIFSNTIYGPDSVISGNYYGIVVRIGSNNTNRINISNNIIDIYGYGIRVNNSKNVNIYQNNLHTTLYGIYLLNGESIGNIQNIEIYNNNLFRISGNFGICLGGTSNSSLGGYSNITVCKNRSISSSGATLAFFIATDIRSNISYFENIIGTYNGTGSLPSYPANKGDIVMYPAGNENKAFIAYEDSLVNEKKYYPYKLVNTQ